MEKLNSDEVFLSHASSDKPVVERIALRLREAGVAPWLDKWNLVPGQPWQPAIEDALGSCAAVAVFIGPNGLAPWHNEEMRAAIQRRVTETGFPVVPVLLPGAIREERGKLPPFLAANTWVEFPTEDDGEAIRRLVCGIRGRSPGPAPSDPSTPAKKPYRGLRAFDVDDTDIYFGREALTDDLLQRLKQQGAHATRFMAILGPSGSGKSSLARAGLLAALKRGKLPGSESWSQLVIRPGENPLEALAIGLLRPWPGSGVDPEQLMTRLATGERALHLHLRVALGNDAARVVLLVDQAEELFSLCADEAKRRAFLENLVYAATVPSGQLVVILAMRADFYPRCASYPQLSALISEHQLLVGAMTPEELRRAIEAPASRAGRPLKPELVAQLVRDVADRPGALPLLEHALEVLWDLPVPSPGIADYLRVGGVAAALDARAESVYLALLEDERRAARQLFLRLVQPGEGTEDTRRCVADSELTVEQRRVSEKFAATGVHLLIRGSDGSHLEVAHEALIREWKRLASWLSEDRHGQRVHRRLTTAATEWASRGRIGDELYPRSRLAEAEEWLETLPPAERGPALNDDEREFLERSRERLDREQHDDRVTARRLKTLLAIAVLSTVFAAIAAVGQRYQRKVAVSRELSARAVAKLGEDPPLSLSLLKAASDMAETEQIPAALAEWKRSSLRAGMRHSSEVATARFSPDGRRIVTASADDTARVWDAATGALVQELKGHTGQVNMAEFSPDGRLIVTASADGTARVWDAATGTLVTELKGHALLVATAEFSPDGRLIVTASDDSTARVWDPATGALVRKLKGHRGPLRTAEFSPDGRRIVTASADNTARVWDAATGALVAELKGHTGPVRTAEFSPDGRRVITASMDKTARVWDAATGALVTELKGHALMVSTATFSPDGRRIVTASMDKTARVWDAATGTLVTELNGHTGPVRTAEFSPDGRRVVTASEDSTARVWDPATGTFISELKGHTGTVARAEFSPDGRHVVTASEDDTAEIWDSGTGTLVAGLKGHTGPVRTAEFSPDGRSVVTASYDNTARVWDSATGTLVAGLEGHTGPVRTAEFSPDGQCIVTASVDGTARVWDSATGALISRLESHTDRVSTAAFSPDGRRVVTASEDNTARVWDSASGALLAELTGHTGIVFMAKFSADGQRVITASSDKTARVWDSVTGSLLAELKGHTGIVFTAELSPDGRRVITASSDKTARVWDSATGALLAELKGNTGPVNMAEFSPDGRLIVTASDDSTARIWDSAPGTLVTELKGHTGPLRTARFSPDGRRVVTASSDNTARVWDSATGSLVAEFKGGGSLNTAKFSPDGLNVVIASAEGAAYLWRDDPALWPRERELEFLNGVRDLTPEERRIYLHEGE